MGMSWEEGLLYFDAWVMPKAARSRDNALRFVEFCCRPEVQAELSALSHRTGRVRNQNKWTVERVS